MEIREFAERILFTTSLEEKLARPDSPITDESPGPALACPPAPGRPDALSFARKDDAPPLPALPALEDESERAILLHFFANHELLATELMALVLLRFPDAPAEFREGLCRTLREEQMHTRWYLNRLRQCGISFGHYPVNHFFWKEVAPVETLLDYVSRLSLTFEQANLDYARHYAGIFARSGDAESARILERVYRDEIGHVNYGLRWFREWKDPCLTDWEAFDARLPFPLSPSRAKANSGAPFNREGRLEAGLDPDFVRRLETFERSKGRTPRVFWFNPGSENRMAGDDETKGLEVAEDLELLMIFLTRRDDILLLRRPPGLEYRERLHGWGFTLPELVELPSGQTPEPGSLLAQRKLAALCPWAWGPDSVETLGSLAANLPDGVPALRERWNAEIESLYRKTTQQEWLRDWIRANPLPSVEEGVVGRAVETEEDLRSALNEWGRERVVIKAPFGASAQKNQRWRGEGTLTWALSILEREGAVVVEPWLERVFDFSMQYEMERSGLRRIGPVRLANDGRGQFQFAQAGPKFCQGLPAEWAQLLSREVLPCYGEALREGLEARLAQAGYFGPVGIDALLYRDEAGRLKWKPVVEINPRYTMGRVCLELSRQVAPGHCVRLSITRGGDAGVPLETPLLDPRLGRLSGGTVLLNEPAHSRSFQAVLRVEKTHGAFTERG